MKAAMLLTLTVIPFVTPSAGGAQHFNGVSVNTVSHAVKSILRLTGL
jgi:hypothetical protein